jgi:hypothetical protein
MDESTEGDGAAFTTSKDRGRGILTPSDRDFLLGRKTDYTEHSKKQKRNRIRRRIRNAVLDFSIIFEHLEERDLETVFDPDEDHREEYTQGIVNMLAFLHLGTMGYYTPFKHMLAEGVNRAEQELAGSEHRLVQVDFNVDPIGRIDVDRVLEKLDRGRYDEITDEELRAFVALLGESDGFHSEEVRSEMKGQMDDFVDRMMRAAEARDERVGELQG